MLQPEARDRHVGLMAVLLEEHPTQHLGTRQARVRQEGRAFSQVEEDGIGLRQIDAVFQLQGWDLADRLPYTAWR